MGKAEHAGLVWVLLAMITMIRPYCAQGDGGLQVGFYSNSCPNLETIVSNGMQDAMAKERRMAASIVRLFFHDCIVQGCDASILLDDTSTFTGEKGAAPNLRSARGFEVLDDIKARVEAACPNLVSCADILALAARDGAALSGGPSWNVALGRRDSLTASFSQANAVIPSPASNASKLLDDFKGFGLTSQDLVALSGAHTFGQARCVLFRNRLYNMSGDEKPDPTLNKYYLYVLRDSCPQSGEGGDDNLSMLDPISPTIFDNRYYLNLMHGRGLLQSDQTLYSSTGSSTVQLVSSYAQDKSLFFSDFATAMVNLGNLNPLTGSQGEIRRNCRTLN